MQLCSLQQQKDTRKQVLECASTLPRPWVQPLTGQMALMGGPFSSALKGLRLSPVLIQGFPERGFESSRWE